MTVPFVTWLRATGLGWLLGIPAIVLLALAGEAVGIGGVQVLVGVGMGIGVGLVQGRAVRPMLAGSWPWVCSSAIGLGVPFLAADLLSAAKLGVPYSLPACVLVGGLIVGIWQAHLLRARFAGTAWWVAGSVAGWGLAAAAAALADGLGAIVPLRGLGGAAAYLGTVASGGLLLGTTTGLVMRRLTPVR